MTLKELIAAGGDIQRLKGAIDRRAGNRWEVFAPDGVRFSGDQIHSMICGGMDDVTERLKTSELEECPTDCACKEEAQSDPTGRRS